MAESREQTRCLIVGAGLGGLALAQSLRKRGITFEIFDRDPADGARSQGWALSLHDWLLEELQDAKKDDMPELMTVAVVDGVGNYGEGTIYDAADMTERTRVGGTTEHQFLRADRAKLRAWLLTHLNVHWGKRFVSYSEDEGGVTAHFADGSTARGDILVGADGINSRVRQQLLAGSDKEPRHVPMGIIVGELDATEEQYRRWVRIAPSFFVGYTTSRRIFIGLKGVNSDKKTARYYWLFGWTDKAAEDEDFWTAKASQQDLQDFVVQKQLDGVHAAFAEILQATPVEGMLHPPLRLRDMTPPMLPLGRVTLLGDAVHPMVPFRGEGGNMAMIDSFRLASVLAAGRNQSVEESLKEYEVEMRERTTKSVLNSRAFGNPNRL